MIYEKSEKVAWTVLVQPLDSLIYDVVTVRAASSSGALRAAKPKLAKLYPSGNYTVISCEPSIEEG